MMKLETIENLEQQDAIAATSLDYIDEMLDDAYTENGFVRLIDESCFGEKERND